MEKYRKYRIMQKLLLKSLSRQEMEQLREVYELFDIDKKGFINVDDFRRVMTKTGSEPSQEELDGIFKDHDMDGDGQVSFGDLVYSTIKNRDQKDYRDTVLKAFNKYDSDLNGVLDVEELQRVLRSISGLENISTSEVQEILKEYDVNGDGVISAAEFVRNIAH